MAAKETTPETVKQPLTAEQQLELISNWTEFSAQFWQSPTPISGLSAFFIRSLLSAAGSRVRSAAPNLSMFRRMLTCAKAGLSANTKRTAPGRKSLNAPTFFLKTCRAYS